MPRKIRVSQGPIFEQVGVFFLIAFFTNIAIGKYLHLKKLSIVAPINGVNEFLLFGVMIMFFSVCSLLKESLLVQNQNGREKNHE